MSFTFSHVFEGKLVKNQKSPCYLNGNIKWYMELFLEDGGNIDITLYGVPLEGFFRPGVHWEILADIEGTVGTTKIKFEQCNFCYDKEEENSYYGQIMIQQGEKSFLGNRKIVKDGKISVNLKIGKISRGGIRVFKQLDFSDSNLPKSDLALSIGEQKLFCHSQYLNLASPVFDKILEEKDYSKKEPLQIELDSEMSVEDFKEFLHQLYFAAEPIREYNWDILLHFSGKYEVSQILVCCENFLLAKLLETELFEIKMNAIEMFPLSCRYGLESLKLECLNLSSSLNDLSVIKQIVTNEHFVAMDDIRKLELVEQLILQRSCKSLLSNNLMNRISAHLSPVLRQI